MDGLSLVKSLRVTVARRIRVELTLRRRPGVRAENSTALVISVVGDDLRSLLSRLPRENGEANDNELPADEVHIFVSQMFADRFDVVAQELSAAILPASCTTGYRAQFLPFMERVLNYAALNRDVEVHVFCFLFFAFTFDASTLLNISYSASATLRVFAASPPCYRTKVEPRLR